MRGHALRLCARALLVMASAAAALAMQAARQCPCLNSYPSAVTPSKVHVNGEVFTYAADYGLKSCNAHDVQTAPFCHTLSPPGWCNSSWCYVDVENCAGQTTALSHYFPGTNLSYSYSTCSNGEAEADFLQAMKCNAQCRAAANASSIPRVHFWTHGSSRDDFWAGKHGVREAAIAASHQFGQSVQWKYFEGNSTDLANNIRTRFLRRKDSEPLITTVPTAEVAAAVTEAARFGASIYGINSVDPSATDDALEAVIRMDEESAGQKAADYLLALGVKRPVFVDHGTPTRGGPSAAFAAGRWRGFSRRILSALGRLPGHIAIGDVGASAQDQTIYVVRSSMQLALTNTTNGLLGTGTGLDPRCRYDGIFTAGSTSLVQTAHALAMHKCWNSGPVALSSNQSGNASGRTLLGTVDRSPVAESLFATGHVQFIVDQSHHLQGYLPVALAALARRKPWARPLLGGVRVDTTSIVVQEANTITNDYSSTEKRCAAFCTLNKILTNKTTLQCKGKEDAVSFYAKNSSHGNVSHTYDEAIRACTLVGNDEVMLNQEQLRCGSHAGFAFCDPISAADLIREEAAAQAKFAEEAKKATREAERVTALHKADAAEARASAAEALTKSVKFSAWMGSAIILVFVGVTALLVRLKRQKTRQLEKEAKEQDMKRQAEEDTQIERVARAITHASELHVPMVVMNFAKFRTLGKLYSHEVARDAGLLTVMDTQSAVSDYQTVFCSHQWLGYKEPDPCGAHHKCICDACDALCACNGLLPSELYVWLDFHSINQTNNALKQLCIKQVPFFAAVSRYFLVVVPQTTHFDHGRLCDLSSYERRGWTRMEQWARVAVGGLENMFISRGDGELARMSDLLSARGRPRVDPRLDPCSPRPRAVGELCQWNLQTAVRVFEGDFTDPSDKKGLVEPVLGLWAMAVSDRYANSRLLYEHVSDVLGTDFVFPKILFGDTIALVKDLLVRPDTFPDRKSPAQEAKHTKRERMKWLALRAHQQLGKTHSFLASATGAGGVRAVATKEVQLAQPPPRSPSARNAVAEREDVATASTLRQNEDGDGDCQASEQMGAVDTHALLRRWQQ